MCLGVVAELPVEVARPALAYISLFRPDGGRGLRWGKALKLLNELRQLISEPYISWDKNPARPNTYMAWAQALEQVNQRPPGRLPLTSHGYLKKVAYDIANEMDRKIEVKKNAIERSGDFRKKEGAVEDPKPFVPSPEDFARIRNAIKGIGKPIN
jgi:hypothetical protein